MKRTLKNDKNDMKYERKKYIGENKTEFESCRMCDHKYALYAAKNSGPMAILCMKSHSKLSLRESWTEYTEEIHEFPKSSKSMDQHDEAPTVH